MSRDLIVNSLVICGWCVLTAGVGMMWLPLGIVAGGVGLIALAVLWP